MLSVYVVCSLLGGVEQKRGARHRQLERKEEERKEMKKLQLHNLNKEADDRRSKKADL